MGFGIDRRARSRKGRGLFRKGPDAKDIGERLGRLIRRVIKDTGSGGSVVRAGWKQDRYIAELRLFEDAPLATLAVEPDAELTLRGDAAGLGPGYIDELLHRLAPLLDELEYVWTEPVDPKATQAAMCAWLASELRGRGTQQLAFGGPEQRRFRIAAPVLTPLGPRDAAWCDAVIADPGRARDAFPWWERGAGREELARALRVMWLEVPWREPLDGDERTLMEKTDELLRAARKADANLELPWLAWKELLVHIGIADEDVDERAAKLESSPGATSAAIGYRRHDLEVELSGGWLAVIPAVMVAHWEDEGERYWATDGDRVIEFSSLTAEGATDSDELLAVAPEAHPVIERFSEGAHRGRAEAFDADGLRIVVGLMACAPHVGILTIKGGDDAWALATWKTLRQVGGSSETR